jgi:hypothetical protein
VPADAEQAHLDPQQHLREGRHGEWMAETLQVRYTGAVTTPVHNCRMSDRLSMPLHIYRMLYRLLMHLHRWRLLESAGGALHTLPPAAAKVTPL